MLFSSTRFGTTLWSMLVAVVVFANTVDAATTREALTPEQLFQQCSKAVVRVICRNAQGDTVSQGSGFCVGDGTTIITNYHVIGGASEASVVSGDGLDTPVSGFVAASALDDIIALKIKKKLPTLALSDTEPTPGARSFAIGSPRNLENTISEGIVSGVRSVGPRVRLLQTTSAISSGSSGGPLLDASGTVVGVVCSYLADAQNLNFAVSSRNLRAVLSAQSATVRPLKRLPGYWLNLARARAGAEVIVFVAEAEALAGDLRSAELHAAAAVPVQARFFREVPAEWYAEPNFFREYRHRAAVAFAERGEFEKAKTLLNRLGNDARNAAVRDCVDRMLQLNDVAGAEQFSQLMTPSDGFIDAFSASMQIAEHQARSGAIDDALRTAPMGSVVLSVLIEVGRVDKAREVLSRFKGKDRFLAVLSFCDDAVKHKLPADDYIAELEAIDKQEPTLRAKLVLAALFHQKGASGQRDEQMREARKFIESQDKSAIAFEWDGWLSYAEAVTWDATERESAVERHLAALPDGNFELDLTAKRCFSIGQSDAYQAALSRLRSTPSGHLQAMEVCAGLGDVDAADAAFRALLPAAKDNGPLRTALYKRYSEIKARQPDWGNFEDWVTTIADPTDSVGVYLAIARALAGQLRNEMNGPGLPR